jgi:DNA repair protein RecO (recombination protein O)
MSLFETEGIILKTYGLSEADKIVLFLTETQGLVRGVAKGAKRLKSRFGGSLEPFTIVQISYFQKEDRELVSISQIELVRSYFEIICEPHILGKFSYLVELIIEFAPPHDPNEKLYRMVKVCLENAVNSPEFLNIITLYFEFWLLRLGGYLPGWENCDICKRQFTANETTFLQTDFHLFCSNCRKGSNQNIISSEQRYIYKIAQKYAPDNFIRFTANHIESVNELSIVLKKMLSRILNREVSDKKILLAHS